MVVRVLVWSYLPIFFLSNGLAAAWDNSLIRGLGLVLPGVYCGYRLLMVGGGRRDLPLPWGTLLVLAYAVGYSVLYYARALTGAALVGGMISLPLHVLFWHAAFHDPVYRRLGSARFLQDLAGSAALGFLFGFANALAFTNWSLEPGQVHNLATESDFVRTDLDIPFLAAVLLFAAALGSGRPTRRVGAATWVLGTLFVALAAVLSLYLYSRRTPLLALGIAIITIVNARAWGSRVSYLLLVMPLVPLFWDLATLVLIPLTQNVIGDAIFARNDLDSIVTGTNRVFAWGRAVAFISQFRLDHFLGYGGVPPNVVPLTSDWEHVHNTFLQLFFEAGIVGVVLGVAVVTGALRRLAALSRRKQRERGAVVLLGVLVIWLVVSGVESAMRLYSVVHMAILVLAVTAENLWHESKKRAAGDAPSPRASASSAANLSASDEAQSLGQLLAR